MFCLTSIIFKIAIHGKGTRQLEITVLYKIKSQISVLRAYGHSKLSVQKMNQIKTRN